MVSLLHVTDFHNHANPGISGAINTLIGQMRAFLPDPRDIWLATVGEVDLAPPQPTPVLQHPLSAGKLARAWRYSSHLRPGLDRAIHARNISVVHIHGAWMYPQLAAGLAASRGGIPIVLTNHGLFSKWALAQPGRLGAIKKQVYLALLAPSFFDHVALYHAITPMDQEAMHTLFPTKRIEVIPNSIDLGSVRMIPQGRQTDSDPYIFFCGRLHPQKGVDILIDAFGHANIPKSWRLIIAGPEDNSHYTAYLRNLVTASPRAERIEMRGPVWNTAEKYELMRDAWVTIVPSRHEVVALVNLESSACRTPTITTHDTGLFDWLKGGGLLIEPAVSSLADALVQAATWSDLERRERGEASYRLVEQRYSTKITGPRWLELYQSLRAP